MQHQTYAIVMAGGSGTRLWPLSTPSRPKPFLDLWGQGPLIRLTLERLGGMIEPDHILIVAAEAHRQALYASVGDAVPPDNLLIEPMGRNTSACIALGALRVRERDPHAVVCVFPSDHYIADVDAFQDAVRRAVDAAGASGRIVLLGMRADRPAPDYGYIRCGGSAAADIFDVLEFMEKPGEEAARAWIARGDALWNAGMFISRADVMLQEIQTHIPGVYEAVSAASAAMKAGEAEAAAWYYAHLPSLSIDHGVMERSRKIAVLPCSFGWDDVGTFDALRRIAKKEANGNALLAGEVSKGVQAAQRPAPDLSIVIPTRNERDNILPLTKRIEEALTDSAEYEILFVDDSDDDTTRLLRDLSRADPRIRCLHRDGERGLATAVLLGFSRARGRWIAVMDADLQHPPELLPVMLDAARAGADVVLPSRNLDGGRGLGLGHLRSFASRAARRLGQALLPALRPASDPTGGFFLFHRGVIAQKKLRPTGWKILMEILVMGEYAHVAEIPYVFDHRASGKSKLSLAVTLEYLMHIVSLLLRGDRAFLKSAMDTIYRAATDMTAFYMLHRLLHVSPMLAATLSALYGLCLSGLFRRSLHPPGERGVPKRKGVTLRNLAIRTVLEIAIRCACMAGLAPAGYPALSNLCGIAAAGFLAPFIRRFLKEERQKKVRYTRYDGAADRRSSEGGPREHRQNSARP